VGLTSRLVSIPRAFKTVIAYLTADMETVRKILTDPDKFTCAPEFLILLTALLVLTCGPRCVNGARAARSQVLH
jgi:hypothetical protein